MIPFVKYHGAGNDFIIIDDRQTQHDFSADRIRDLCDRHFGIGADGLIQIRNKSGYDFEMLYFNSDGMPGSMCGNGGRCAVAYSHTLGLIKKDAKLLAFDGGHDAKIISENPYIIRLKMNDVDKIVSKDDHLLVDTGSPHFIRFTDHVDQTDVRSEGMQIRYSEPFRKEGINVNFVQMDNESLHIRTYERGVEDETLSCGTGVTASVLAAAFSGKTIISGCEVITPGGKLRVYFHRNGNGFSDIWLEGPAQKVFEGIIS